MAIVYRVAKGSPLTNAEVDANFLHLDTIKANEEITVTGTNGLTGGGNLSANRTLALGTPSTLTTTSTNSASGTTHNHALNLSGRSINSGNGLVGGRDLGADVTLALGTPSTLTTTSTNSATSTTHNHALNLSGRVITSGSYLTGGGNLGSNLTLNVSATTTASANVVAARDNAADIHARLFRPNYPDAAGISGAIAFRANNSDNNYIRFCNNVANIRTYIGANNAANLNAGIIPSARLLHNHSRSLSTNGYQRLPSGLMLQWGVFSFGVTEGANIVRAFPVAFPVLCLNASVSEGSGYAGVRVHETIHSVQSRSASTITIRKQWVGDAAGPIQTTHVWWFAIGY